MQKFTIDNLFGESLEVLVPSDRLNCSSHLIAKGGTLEVEIPDNVHLRSPISNIPILEKKKRIRVNEIIAEVKIDLVSETTSTPVPEVVVETPKVEEPKLEEYGSKRKRNRDE